MAWEGPILFKSFAKFNPSNQAQDLSFQNRDRTRHCGEKGIRGVTPGMKLGIHEHKKPPAQAGGAVSLVE
jgi:hypothetical protein